MDEKVEASASETEAVEAGVSPANREGAADAAAAAPERPLDLNELQDLSEKKLRALARDLDLFLNPARSRHQHILDIIRTALAGGATVAAEGFLDQVSDSFAMLRWPKLNFLPLPEDVEVQRAASPATRAKNSRDCSIAGSARKIPLARQGHTHRRETC